VGSASELGIVTEQHGGTWFISPTATVVDSVVGALRATTREDARRVVWAYSGRFWLLFPDDFWKACGIERPALDATMEAGDRAANQCIDQLPDDYTGFGGSPFLYGSFGEGSSESYSSGEGSSAPYTDVPPEVARCLDAAEEESEMDACFADLDGSGANPPLPSESVPTTAVPVRPTIPPSTLIPPTTAPASTTTAPPPTTSAPTTTVAGSTTTSAP
jgi:hypothetical protein